MLAACNREGNKMRPGPMINHSMDMLPEPLLYYHTLMKEKMDSPHCCYHGRVSTHSEKERQRCVWRKGMINQPHFSFIWCKFRMGPPHHNAHITAAFLLTCWLLSISLGVCIHHRLWVRTWLDRYFLFSLKIKLILLIPTVDGYSSLC